MRSVIGSIVFLVCAALSPCCCCFPAPLPEPEPTPEPAPVPVPPEPMAVNYCHGACQNMARLKCRGWEGSAGRDETTGTADDVPCVQVCTDFEHAAIISRAPDLSLHPACVAGAQSCMEAAGCFGQ